MAPGLPMQFCSSPTSPPLVLPPTSDAACDFDFGEENWEECPLGQFCTEALPLPNSGIVGFRSLGYSLVTIFRISSRPPAASFIMRGTMQATSSVAALFFVAILVFVSFLVLSLFIAIVRGSFGAVKKRHSARLTPESLRARAQEWRLVSIRDLLLLYATANQLTSLLCLLALLYTESDVCCQSS